MTNPRQAQRNRMHVRILLRQKQPEFAAVLESAAREVILEILAREPCHEHPDAHRPEPGLIATGQR